MTTPRANTPDLVMLASLHAALDGILEIEALFAESEPAPLIDRAGDLASELRLLLLALLRRPGS